MPATALRSVFFKCLTFKANPAGQTVLAAVNILRTLDTDTPRRAIPKTAPLDLIPSAWQPYVLDEHGKVNRRHYELCTLWVLRQALRSGNVWVGNSHRYADPETYLIRRQHWPEKR